MRAWAVTMVSEPRCRADVPAKLGPERGEGEWNIDGRSDHEVFITLQRILIAYTAYSTKRATDLQAFDLLTSGFTGILKN